MEEKVQCMLKLIEEDGDSFAKRAEMYYKRRPELISSVEDTYRAFKALADRYDLLSKELQNANTTIATVFPEQVQFAIEDDDDFTSRTPKFPKKSKNSAEFKGNIPKVPKAPMESIKGFINTASKQFQPKKSSSKTKFRNKFAPKSGLSKDEALQQIDQVHKEILGLQTVKEYVKSSYENGLAKYWEIENRIMEMQEKVSKLQDEYEVEIVIEDHVARTLMAEAALKSCQETLTMLQEKQDKSTREAKEESKKIEAAREMLKTFKRNYMKEELNDEKPIEDVETETDKDEHVGGLIQVLKELDPLQKKAEKSMDTSSKAILTVTELAEKIDELVNKVINLETAVSSQTVLINTLRTEADDMHAQVKNLEDEKETLIGDTQKLSIKVKEMEDKLHRIQNLSKSVENQNSNLETNFAEARSSLKHLSKKLSSVKPDEEVEQSDSNKSRFSSVQEDASSSGEGKSKKKKKDRESKKKKKDKKKDQNDVPSTDESQLQEIDDQKDIPSTDESKKCEKKDKKKDQKDIPSTDESQLQEIEDLKDVPSTDESTKSVSSSQVKEKEEVKEVDVSVHAHSKPSVPKQEEFDKPVDSSLAISDMNPKEDKPSVPKQEEVDKPVDRSLSFSDMKPKDDEPSVPKQEEVDKPVDNSLAFSDMKPKEDEDVPVPVPVEDQSNEPVKAPAGEKEKEGELSWQQMLLSGAEDRDKILLKEYTTILRNYKDVKRKLSDTEKKDRDIQFDITLQMRELKQAILKRDQEIQHLRQQLTSLQGNKDTTDESGAPSNSCVEPTQDSEVNEDVNIPVAEKEEDDFKSFFLCKSPSVSLVEEQLRMELDGILDENLDFWLRFSTSFHQVQKFKNEVVDLQGEIVKLKDRKKLEGNVTPQIKSEVRPIYKHLREIQTELTVWLEQSYCLKEELKRRFTSLCKKQEEITTALKEGVEEDEIKFSSHQAAKLQGEILNMKQENNKVREELQACFDLVSVLQLDVEKTLRQLNGQFGIACDQPQLQHSMSKARVPLRSFIFGAKEKKHKNSLFSFMHPNRKYHVVRALPPAKCGNSGYTTG